MCESIQRIRTGIDKYRGNGVNISILQQNDELFFLLGGDTLKDTSYYSLVIGIGSYLKTYNSVVMSLRSYHEEESVIDNAVRGNDKYIECYLNIAIHIQHFFELEVKRILDNENRLYAVDTKGDPLITYKLLNNIEIQQEDTEKLKFIEFSDAINRLGKLVDNNIIDDEIARLFVANKELLKGVNYLRNTTLHRGRKLMNYCALDKLFSQNLLPLIKALLDQPYYSIYKSFFCSSGIYDVVKMIIDEGKKSTINYSQIALLKEIGRSKLELVLKPKLDEIKDKEYIEMTLGKKMLYNYCDVVKTEKQCPCCGYKTILNGRELVGYDIDELGDEMGNGSGFQIIHVPDYEEFYECAWCGFRVSTFIDL